MKILPGHKHKFMGLIAFINDLLPSVSEKNMLSPVMSSTS
jgi:hypothetical protein